MDACAAGISSTPQGLECIKGAELGKFLLGSSVVLVFEAPTHFQFSIEEGERVKVGQSLGELSA